MAESSAIGYQINVVLEGYHRYFFGVNVKTVIIDIFLQKNCLKATTGGLWPGFLPPVVALNITTYLLMC